MELNRSERSQAAIALMKSVSTKIVGNSQVSFLQICKQFRNLIKNQRDLYQV